MFSGRGGSRNYRISGRGGGPSLTDVLVIFYLLLHKGAQWLSGRVLDLRPKGRGFEPHRRHCVVSLSKNINPSLVLVQPRKTRPYITERLLMGRKESNQTNKQNLLLQSVPIDHSKGTKLSNREGGEVEVFRCCGVGIGCGGPHTHS